MNQLPKRGLPAGLLLEPPAKLLASLTVNEAYRELERTVISQWGKQDKFTPLQQWGIGPINRALFVGPPGNGKTVSAQLIASKLGCPLYRVACEMLVSKYVGDMTRHVAEIMSFLELQDTCVVLWDEVETIFPGRQVATGVHGQETGSAMTVFWQRLDRWEGPQLFLLATNMPEQLDPALRSRIELQVEFGPPTREQALAVLEYWRETLHEYGADQWSPQLESRITKGRTLNFPLSFRELWQTIQQAARNHVVST